MVSPHTTIDRIKKKVIFMYFMLLLVAIRTRVALYKWFPIKYNRFLEIKQNICELKISI